MRKLVQRLENRSKYGVMIYVNAEYFWRKFTG